MTDEVCLICGKPVAGSVFRDFRGNSVCGWHTGIEYCHGCGCLVGPTDFRLSDGRILCSGCRRGMVSHPEDVEWIIARVREVLAENGIAELSPSIKLKIVSPREMGGIRGDGEIRFSNPGLTKSKIEIDGIYKRTCSHTIYVIDSIPKVKFAGVLAHEILHTWLTDHKFDFGDALTEGFCNLGTYLIYVKISNDYSFRLLDNMRKDPDEVYGDGFRKVLKVFERSRDLTAVARRLRELHE